MKKLLQKLLAGSALAVMAMNATPANAWTVYFDNTLSQWTTPYIYGWGGSAPSTGFGAWAGVAMTKVSGSANLWSYSGSDSQVPANILFTNAGNENNGKSSDYTFEDGAYYPLLFVVGNSVDGKSWTYGVNQMTYDNNTGLYTWTGSILGSGFKINDIQTGDSWRDWFNIGAEEGKTNITEDIPLAVINGNASKDITFTGGTFAEPKVVFNPSAMTVTLSGQEEPLPTLDEVLGENIYIAGLNDDWVLETDHVTLLPKAADKVYSGDVTINASDTNQLFRFYVSLDYGYDTFTYGYNANEGTNLTVSFTDQKYSGKLVEGKGCWVFSGFDGVVTMTVNFNDNSVTFVQKSVKVEYPENIYITGEFNGWNPDEPLTLTAINKDNGTYTGTFTIPEFTDEGKEAFNLKVIKYQNWDVDWGIDESLYLYKGENGPYNLVEGNPDNNIYAGNWKGGQVTFNVDLENLTITITTPDQIAAPDYDKIAYLYLVGNMNGWKLMDEDYIIPETTEGSKIYEATFDIPATIGDDNAWPSLKIGTYDNWNYAYGYAEEAGTNVKIYNNVPGKAILTRGTGTGNITLDNWEGGQLTVRVDLNTNTLTLSGAGQPKLQPESLWLVGPFQGWSLSNTDFTLEQQGENSGIYKRTFELDETVEFEDTAVNAADFKVAFGTSDDWSEVFGQTGGSFPLYSTTTFEGDIVANGDGIGNWTISNWVGGELTVTVDLNEATITIEAEGQPEKVAPGDELYLIGAPQGWDIESDEIVLGKTADGIYSGTYKIADDEFNFILYTALGDWESNYIGAPSTASGNFNVPLTDNGYTGPITESKTNWLISDWKEATVTITVDIEEGTITFSNITVEEGPSVDEPTGDGDDTGAVTAIGEDANAPEVIYNLQGLRVDRNKMTRGIYIINGKKVMVK